LNKSQKNLVTLRGNSVGCVHVGTVWAVSSLYV